MKKGIYFITLLLLAACSQEEKTDVSQREEIILETEERTTVSEEPVRLKRDTVHTDTQPEAPKQLATYSGRWFRIEYPKDFVASPTTPINAFETYRFVDTDEARFTSPDGTVEFFVFSPQWGGDPIDYLIEQANEKTVDHSEEKSNSEDPFAASHHWVTYEDKEGKYTRSYHSVMSESTHHVFGVKYSNRKMYERYKAAYLAFKNSLQQFAD